MAEATPRPLPLNLGAAPDSEVASEADVTVSAAASAAVEEEEALVVATAASEEEAVAATSAEVVIAASVNKTATTRLPTLLPVQTSVVVLVDAVDLAEVTETAVDQVVVVVVVGMTRATAVAHMMIDQAEIATEADSAATGPTAAAVPTSSRCVADESIATLTDLEKTTAGNVDTKAATRIRVSCDDTNLSRQESSFLSWWVSSVFRILHLHLLLSRLLFSFYLSTPRVSKGKIPFEKLPAATEGTTATFYHVGNQSKGNTDRTHGQHLESTQHAENSGFTSNLLYHSVVVPVPYVECLPSLFLLDYHNPQPLSSYHHRNLAR